MREADDAAPLLHEFALDADRKTEGTRWSYCRDNGNVRLIVLDSRAGRVLDPGKRTMVDEEEWDWFVDHVKGDFDHLLIASSLPILLPGGEHGLESWNEAVAEGAWGKRASRMGEKVRQTLDLEHWAAFRRSFERMSALLEEVASGKHGKPPATIVLHVRRRPPRLPRRGGVPEVRGGPLGRVPGDLLAVPQRAEHERARGWSGSRARGRAS